MRRYSDEEKVFLKEIIPGRSYAEITALFNTKFENPITAGQVNTFIGNHKLNTGRTGHFPKGHIPANKGKKGWCAPGSEKSHFKKGHTPVNHRSVGSTRVNVDGYTEIKVEEPRKWRPLHVVIYEEANGPVPKGHAIIFGDGNKQNTDIENLILVSRAELAMLNKYNLIGASADLTKIGILIADLRMKMHSKRKKKGGVTTE